MWGLAQIGDEVDRIPEHATDPLSILLDEGWDRPAIKQAVNGLWEPVFDARLSSDLSAIERSILRTCVENTNWIAVYRTTPPTRDDPQHIEEALGALRSLATKLDTVGVAVNHLPFG